MKKPLASIGGVYSNCQTVPKAEPFARQNAMNKGLLGRAAFGKDDMPFRNYLKNGASCGRTGVNIAGTFGYISAVPVPAPPTFSKKKSEISFANGLAGLSLVRTAQIGLWRHR